MSFVSDKKKEHEVAAEKFLAEKNFGKAFFHTAKAAEFGMILAEQSEGKVAQRYADDALELLEIAATLKDKSKQQGSELNDRKIKDLSNTGETAGQQWQISSRPSERLADVAGLSVVKQELQEKVIDPFLHPELYDRFKVKSGGGVLMYGPPGNGKTFLAKAVAGELDAAFFNVNASRIKDKYVGETEKNLQKLFDEARTHARSIIFLDEADHLLSRVGNQKVGAVNQFLTLMDGFEKSDSCVMVLAATNKPEMLDAAVLRPGRLGTLVYVGPPDAPARQAIMLLNLRDVPKEADVNIENIVEKTDGYSGADIAEICNRMKISAIKRQLASGKEEQITAVDALESLGRVQPSITAEQVQYFTSWREKRE